MVRLKLININCCACGSKATRALSVVCANGQKVALPFCNVCTPIGKMETLPSHEPSILEHSLAFPPKSGEWFKTTDNDVLLGCPQCNKSVSLTKIHKIMDGGKLHPSFICPHCKLHLFLTLKDWTND